MKIAIIGSGISGLGAAYLLAPQHDITLYEKNDYIGGHSRTVNITTATGETVPVDTGFIVFNERNYPNLTALFKQLDVPVVKSHMSFGVSIEHSWLEYGTHSPLHFFAQTRNLIRPQFWRMIRDILTFNKRAKEFLDKDESITLGECLDELQLHDWFRNYFLLAMGGAIWSTPVDNMLAFPAKTFIRFFDNHGLLTLTDQPQWHTVVGGSKQYVKKLTANFSDHIKLNCGVESVTRQTDGIMITDSNGATTTYDHVIFACHSDQIMQLLNTPTKDETDIISSIAYQPNRMILHSDISFMPRRKKAWSSWIYMSETRTDTSGEMCLSYWMNNLQPLQTETPIIVTLNPHREPDSSLVYDEYNFEHPVFNANAINAQDKLENINGTDRISFCGAWQRYGFHEDGLASAVNVAEKLGATIPWK